MPDAPDAIDGQPCWLKLRFIRNAQEAAMRNEVARVYFQKLARQVGYRSALRAMRRAHFTREECRDTLSPLRHCVRVR